MGKQSLPMLRSGHPTLRVRYRPRALRAKQPAGLFYLRADLPRFESCSKKRSTENGFAVLCTVLAGVAGSTMGKQSLPMLRSGHPTLRVRYRPRALRAKQPAGLFYLRADLPRFESCSKKHSTENGFAVLCTVLAGVAGFEPTNAAVKVLCLTA